MRDLFVTAIYIETLGTFAFTALVLLALGVEAVKTSGLRKRWLNWLAILTLVGVGTYVIAGGLWDAALAFYIANNPTPLVKDAFFYFELSLQIYQSVMIWLAIPLAFIIRWQIKREYRRV